MLQVDTFVILIKFVISDVLIFGVRTHQICINVLWSLCARLSYVLSKVRIYSPLLNTSGTLPASPGNFLKKIYINMTINIIHILSNVVKISSNLKK